MPLILYGQTRLRQEGAYRKTGAQILDIMCVNVIILRLVHFQLFYFVADFGWETVMNFEDLLAREVELPPNCFSFGEDGLTEGIRIAFPKDDGLKPYLPVGKYRLVFDKRWGPLYHKMEGERPRVRRAIVHTVTPFVGDTSFEVLRGTRSEPDGAIILINTSMRHRHLKDETVNPWRGVSGSAEIVRWDGDEVLVRINPAEHVYVFTGDGGVFKLTLLGSSSEVEVRDLPPEEAAYARAEAAAEQLTQPWAQRPQVLEGILYGIISLLPLTRGHLEARDHFIEFLKRDDLTDGMRRRIRIHLEGLGDDRASSGWWDVRDNTPSTTVSKGPATEKLAKRNARREADADQRHRMRGMSGGGASRTRRAK